MDKLKNEQVRIKLNRIQHLVDQVNIWVNAINTLSADILHLLETKDEAEARHYKIRKRAEHLSYIASRSRSDHRWYILGRDNKLISGQQGMTDAECLQWLDANESLLMSDQ